MFIKTMSDEIEPFEYIGAPEPCDVCGELVKETFIKFASKKVTFVCEDCLKPLGIFKVKRK